jgi:hypothetical protein
VSRKGKASSLEAGRGKYSPPANPERVTSEGLKRRDKGVHVSKQKYLKNSTGYENIVSKTPKTPDSFSEYPDFLGRSVRPLRKFMLQTAALQHRITVVPKLDWKG